MTNVIARYADAFVVFSMKRECLIANTCKDKLKTLPDLSICFLPKENLIYVRYYPIPAFEIISDFLPQV